MRRLLRPSPAPVSSASEASSRRQLDGNRPDWEISRTAPAAAMKSSNSTPAEALNSRPRPDPDPGLGDRAEDPLRAGQQAVGRGTGAGTRQPPALPGPARGDRPHRLDQVLDVGIDGREVPAGPGRDPAAEGRVLEGLREVAQGQPVLAQLRFQPRPGRPGLDSRRQRCRVDLQHPVQPPQVHRHHRPIPEPRLHPADDAGPAPERNHRRPLGLRPAQNRLDLRLVPRKRDQIRRILEFPPKPPHHVPIGLPQPMRNPLVVAVGEQIPQPIRRLQPGLPNRHILQRNRPLNLPPKPKPLPDPFRRLPHLSP